MSSGGMSRIMAIYESCICNMCSRYPRLHIKAQRLPVRPTIVIPLSKGFISSLNQNDVSTTSLKISSEIRENDEYC